MRLSKLSSSNKNFKTLLFNPGLNIVSGLQLSKEEKKTINGIGKSLSLKLIHHILGADFKTPEEKKLESFLKQYGKFYLEFTHRNKNYVIAKNFADKEYYINKEEILKTKYRQELTNIFLGKDSKITFRQAFNVFSRRFGGSYYVDVLTQQGVAKNDYSQKYVNLYLLGIDVALVEKKESIKKRMNNLKIARESIGRYEQSSKHNPKDINDRLKELKKRKSDFIIAKNYDEIKKEADHFTNQLNSIRDEIYEKEKLRLIKKRNFDNSSNINIDIDQVEKIYHEANFFFQEKIKKRLHDAQEFHNKLIQSRKDILSEELRLLESKTNELCLKKDAIGKQRDEKL
ncbi:MAG: hypothetical protein OXB84_03645, partial [Halobacteriovoraceae bacterium]|nr:hypothetical protein [Halobacteriovoraceae bacterium]